MPVLDLFDLRGRRALITGGSRGLGLEMARALGEAGAELVLVGSDLDHLGTAAGALAKDGISVVTVQADLSSPAGAELLCDRVLAEHAPVDILINNVGGRRINTPTEDLSLEEWQRILDLNLTQAFILTKRLGAAMIRVAGKNHQSLVDQRPLAWESHAWAQLRGCQGSAHHVHQGRGG